MIYNSRPGNKSRPDGAGTERRWRAALLFFLSLLPSLFCFLLESGQRQRQVGDLRLRPLFHAGSGSFICHFSRREGRGGRAMCHGGQRGQTLKNSQSVRTNLEMWGCFTKSERGKMSLDSEFPKKTFITEFLLSQSETGPWRFHPVPGGPWRSRPAAGGRRRFDRLCSLKRAWWSDRKWSRCFTIRTEVMKLWPEEGLCSYGVDFKWNISVMKMILDKSDSVQLDGRRVWAVIWISALQWRFSCRLAADLCTQGL